MSHVRPRTIQLADGRTLTLRTPDAEDAPALVEHMLRLRGTSNHLVIQPDEDHPDEAELRETIAKSLASPVKLMIVARLDEDPDHIVAELSFHGHERRRMSHHGQFGIGVDSDMRGLGIGRLLITEMLEWAAMHETIEKVTLGVMETNRRARKLYKSLGFVKECREQRFFRLGPGEYVDDIMMSQYVKPGVAPEGYCTWKQRVESAET